MKEPKVKKVLKNLKDEMKKHVAEKKSEKPMKSKKY